MRGGFGDMRLTPRDIFVDKYDMRHAALSRDMI